MRLNLDTKNASPTTRSVYGPPPDGTGGLLDATRHRGTGMFSVKDLEEPKWTKGPLAAAPELAGAVREYLAEADARRALAAASPLYAALAKAYGKTEKNGS